jgi:putative ABC transport system permease protein
MMIRNYLLVGYRNAVKNRATSLINVLGLSVGVAIAVTAYIFMDFMWHMDDFHANKNRVFQVISEVAEENRTAFLGASPRMLGPSLSQDNPTVEATARVKFGSASVRYGDNVFNEPIWFVDPAFQQIFSFPIYSGTSTSLRDKNTIVISRRISEKYFNNSRCNRKTDEHEDAWIAA